MAHLSQNQTPDVIVTDIKVKKWKEAPGIDDFYILYYQSVCVCYYFFKYTKLINMRPFRGGYTKISMSVGHNMLLNSIVVLSVSQIIDDASYITAYVFTTLWNYRLLALRYLIQQSLFTDRKTEALRGAIGWPTARWYTYLVLAEPAIGLLATGF